VNHLRDGALQQFLALIEAQHPIEYTVFVDPLEYMVEAADVRVAALVKCLQLKRVSVWTV
jgi:hypothetical protein